MQEEDYKILAMLNKEQSFTKAAKRLFMSQPLLSYRLKKIEKDFGINIVEKMGNQFKFTPEGEYLVKFSNKVLFEIQNLKSNINELRENLKGNMKLGANTNFAIYTMPELIQQYYQAYTDIYISMTSGWSIEILEQMENNDLDVGILTGDYDWYGQKILLKRDPLTIISKKPISLKHLHQEYRIVYKSHQNFNTYIELENSITKSINDWWNERYDTYARNIFQADKIEICKKFVEKGMGYAIVPKSCILDNDSFYTKDLKFKNGDSITRNTWLLYREEAMNNDIKNFISFCKIYFEIE
ncbi:MULTISPECIES: LysR family transcriptional regulator [Staphylococcus]|uniref:LysR family transcriptional regulator n=2 Tax=Staphylococcus nepalensis TaxID=214473 RepID=A0A2T4SB52_9STAP|nr:MULTISPECIES: LysR family transcriptional regulator [Staphylococcus]VDG65855.1 LysR family transcriptional regulator [Lacrimispora indolis]MBO1206291.1 LysR family transcriptional regulator [Staphylococcus nepalensis]MBO1212300.1 LysR family transcriptional regulator [Staphylococcus nepalensis]MBO1217063.1 LysR family transcriptional regulator [Staphylococcus nepalensis]MBO1222283.1 LysR family transcriptional regulator [Staphylococcus nepalensis]